MLQMLVNEWCEMALARKKKKKEKINQEQMQQFVYICTYKCEKYNKLLEY